MLYIHANTVYKAPFDVVGGPIGPRFVGGVDSVTTIPADDVLTFDAFVVRLEFNDDEAFPTLFATLPPVPFDVIAVADVVIAFVDDFVMKNFSNFAIICLPYVYLRSEFMCGRILCIKILRCVGSDTSIIFCTT